MSLREEVSAVARLRNAQFQLFAELGMKGRKTEKGTGTLRTEETVQNNFCMYLQTLKMR